MLTGDHVQVPKLFRELMDIDVINQQPVVHWIPYHMTKVLLALSRLNGMPVTVRSSLAAICNQFENFRSHKIKSGDGWEALFIITLLTSCLTKCYCKLVPLYGSNCEVSWNEPFSHDNFDCKKVEEFISGIPYRRKEKSIAVYFPSHAQFEVYDVILAYRGDNLERKLFGYQLKEGSTIPKNFPMDCYFHHSYLIRGLATTKDTSIRQWSTPSDDMLDQFFGESAKYWSPKCWAALKNSGNPAPVGNGETSP
jgi:hypothetical protein